MSNTAELQEVVDRIVYALREAISSERDMSVGMELAKDECRRIEYETNNLHIANSVLDNCLSALKHETMYYPSRIRQLVDNNMDGNVDAMKELVEYYRDIYSILSRQAVRQIERMKLMFSPVLVDEILSGVGKGFCVIGNRNLLEFLFDILRKQNGRVQPEIKVEPTAEMYLLFTVYMPGVVSDTGSASHLFVPSIDNIPFLLCRQIVRDHSEATNRRGCGISASVCGNTTVVRIILPRHL